MSLKCTLLIASIISICTITHSELLKRVLAWKRWPSKLPLFAPHSESILPSDTEREFVNEYWILYFIMLMLMNSFSDYDKNLELAQLVQQKLDAYKVQIPNTHIYSIANINQSLLLTKFIFYWWFWLGWWSYNGWRCRKSKITIDHFGQRIRYYNCTFARTYIPGLNWQKSLALKIQIKQIIFLYRPWLWICWT